MRPKIALQTLAGIALAGVLWLTGASVAVAEHALRRVGVDGPGRQRGGLCVGLR